MLVRVQHQYGLLALSLSRHVVLLGLIDPFTLRVPAILKSSVHGRATLPGPSGTRRGVGCRSPRAGYAEVPDGVPGCRGAASAVP